MDWMLRVRRISDDCQVPNLNEWLDDGRSRSLGTREAEIWRGKKS